MVNEKMLFVTRVKVVPLRRLSTHIKHSTVLQ